MSDAADKKRKIAIDAGVAMVALRGIAAVERDELTNDQVRELIVCDECYFDNVGRIAPQLTEGIER